MLSSVTCCAWVQSAPLDLITVDRDSGGFPLAEDGRAAPICIPPDAPDVVRIAAGDLAEDIERVTGLRPELREERPAEGPQVVVFSPAELAGRWETYQLSASEDRLSIAGSDARALAYGIYDLSERIGVSPWYWWADVPVVERSELWLEAGTGPLESPAVRYRGIFLNDEDWGLEPWASRTFEPEVGTIGPKTYTRIFELMLRLRANTLWPAMHKCTTAFHLVPGNSETADDYAIVLGSSHAEPMLRNNVGEWTGPGKDYDYTANREGVLEYWEERVAGRTAGESIFTLGMRGIHDSAIVGPKSREERIQTLERIFRDQRNLLARHLGDGDPTRVAQMFCPYKEVLDDYNAGLKVPEDVTLVWPDDNFGYIRRFPTAEERSRSGGSGVYYHLSYLGSPMAWLWFDSLPPAFVWSEMRKAYEQGAREIWIANVGDLKGNEQSTEWFLDLAWNADKYGPESGLKFLERMAARDFGVAHATAIAGLWARHQALAFARKPEHLQWHLPLTPYQPGAMTSAEIRRRLADYGRLIADAEALRDTLPDAAQDAAFQLLYYPIACANAANERYFQLELIRRGEADGDLEPARTANRRIAELTRRYNEDLRGGKWRHVMSAGGLSKRDWLRFQPTPFDQQVEALPGTQPGPSVRAGNTGPELASSPAALDGPGFVEVDGVVSIHAGHFTGRNDKGEGGWRSVPGLGRTGSAVTVLPSTYEGEATLSYRFHVASGGVPGVRLRLLPTHPIDGGGELRVACAVDSGDPVTVVIKDHEPKSEEWKEQVLANATYVTARFPVELIPGWHTLHLIAVSPGVVVDKIVIDFGGLRPSYDGPPETRIPG